MPTPRRATAEVASIVLVVAAAAQWCELALSPALAGDPVDGIAVVAKPSCLHPAIDARPDQHRVVAQSQELHVGYGEMPGYAGWFTDWSLSGPR